MMRTHGVEDLEIDRLFHALADATRRDIVRITLDTELSVSDLASLYPMSFAAVQKHVAVLERARLITKQRRGREQLVHGNVEALRQASALLDQIELRWRQRIGRLAEVLADPPTDPTTQPTTEPTHRESTTS